MALDPFQSSFCPGWVLVTLTDHLHRQLDGRGSALILLLDLTAQKITGCHDLLTHCLADTGVCGVALKWLSSFLLGQGQRVAIGGKGVLNKQGSSRGNLLIDAI